MGRRSCRLLWSICPLVLALRGEQGPVIRTNVQVVEVSIVATNAKGSPAEGLKAADFRVWDNGKEQIVTGLEKIRSQAAYVPANLPPDTYSNRFGNAGQPRVLSMILLDAVNTKGRYQAIGRHAVETILEQMKPGERVALYAFGSELRVLHEFSSDKRLLLARIRAYHGELTPRDDLLRDYRLPSNLPPPAYQRQIFDHDRVVNTFAAMEALANHVKGEPGRKNLVWVSEGFPLLVGGGGFVDHFQKELGRAMAALNDAGVSVYPIDLSVNGNIGTFRDVADSTGGKAYYNRNDFDRGVRLALDDSREVYWLTYSPDTIAQDGAYHRIRVQTTRRGVELRYRLGYYAPGREEDSSVVAKDRMTELISSPLDASGIGIQATVKPAADQIALAIRIDPADPALAPSAGKWTGALQLAAMQTGAAGERLGGVNQAAEINLDQATYERAREQGLPFEMKFPRQAAAVAVRIGVVDDRGGNAGSLSVPLPPIPGTGAPAVTKVEHAPPH